MSKVIIKLVKSPIGYEKSQRDTVVALGFKKRRGGTVQWDDK